jgi:competence protein ComEC
MLDLGRKISYNIYNNELEVLMANYKKRRRIRKYPIAIVVLVVILALAYLTLDYFGYSIEDLFRPEPPAREPVEGEIRVHVIDVGQADCILIETPDGCMLIDSGIDESEAHLEAYLTSLGITEIDYFLITHAHADHYEGADMVISEFTVKNFIYDNDVCNKYTTIAKARTLIKDVAKKGINAIDVKVGDKFSLGEAEFTVLCADWKNAKNDNDNSIVVRLDYGESSFIFTGDATKVCEDYMIETWSSAELDCDFLKSGHHGSHTSSSAGFLEATTPEFIAISCGRGNDYGHPHKVVMDRYEDTDATIHRTDL